MFRRKYRSERKVLLAEDLEMIGTHAMLASQEKQSHQRLIVMGRRGSRGLARIMVGDATARVIGHAHCNVLVVPRAGKLWQSRITLGTDGTAHSEGAAAAAINWAKHSRLPLSIVSATVRSHSRERKSEAQEAAGKVESVAIACGHIAK